MTASQPRPSFGALALVVSLAIPVGFLGLVSRSTTGEKVDAADLVVVARVSALQFIEEPPRTIIELVVDHSVFGRPSGPSLNLLVDGRSPLAAGDTVLALIGEDPSELLGTCQVRKNPTTLEHEVVSEVTGMLAQGVRGGGEHDPIPLGVLELGIRSRRGVAAPATIGGSGQMAATAPKGVTAVLPDAHEPNNSLAARTPVTGFHPPLLVTGHPLILSGLSITLGDVDFFSMEAGAYTLLFASTLPPEATGLPVPDTYIGIFDASPPGELLAVDDDGGEGSFSQLTYLFEEGGPVAVAVESAPDAADLFDGSTGTTEGYYRLSLEFKLGSFMVNGLDTVIGVSPDGTFIQDMVGYKFIGGDDVLLTDIVPADGWALDFEARSPSGVTQVYGGSGEQLTDPGFTSAVKPISFELGEFQSSAGINRRGFSEASAMVLQATAPDRGVTVTHTYTLPLFDDLLTGELALQIATDDQVNNMLFTRVTHVDLFDDGTDTFSWSFDPLSNVKAFAVPVTQNVGNLVVPTQFAAAEADVDRQFALWIDKGDTPAGSFGASTEYLVAYTLVEGYPTEDHALQAAVRNLRFEAGAETWVVAVDLDPATLTFAAFGVGTRTRTSPIHDSC
ncbi:MAG TPA: hypothetical protein VFD43_02850, partial [Planctomycetota bacterium]|nr:hypothetical protein [Planctomycetota bacterium]